MRTWFVYRHFDGKGRLLYIGMSISPMARMMGHSRTVWFDKVRTVTIEPFKSKEEARLAEAAAISKEKPKFNRTHVASNFVIQSTGHFNRTAYQREYMRHYRNAHSL